MGSFFKEIVKGDDGRIRELDGSEKRGRPKDAFLCGIGLKEIRSIDNLNAKRVFTLCDVIGNVNVDDLIDGYEATKFHVCLAAIIRESERSKNEITFLPLTNLSFVSNLVDVSLKEDIVFADSGRRRRSLSGLFDLRKHRLIVLCIHALDAIALDDPSQSLRGGAAHRLWTFDA